MITKRLTAEMAMQAIKHIPSQDWEKKSDCLKLMLMIWIQQQMEKVKKLTEATLMS